jgi:transcriptional regulator with XRE-family HTH domain
MRITVKAARVNAGLTQREAASALGMATTTYNKLEQNPRLMRIEQVEKIAGLFGVDLDSLFFGRDFTTSEVGGQPS